MPTSDCISILRHVNSKLFKNYTYRPNRVYAALKWLKLNNHLYADIELVWSTVILDWENNIDNIEIPVIELSDDEISD